MKISYDFHMHSCLSPCGDNDMTPNNIVNMAMLLGLDAIAVSDHNSAMNLPAVFAVAEEAGLTVVPAIEVCTSEEIHILCMTYTLEDILAFGKEIYQYLPDFQNDPTAFGNQFVVDKEDKLLGIEQKILINALEINVDKLLELVKKYDGVAIPAHVDKNSFSMVASLGYIPPEYNFSCIEVRDKNAKIDFSGKRITDSDAHYLEHMKEAENYIEVKENSVKSIVDYLKGVY